MLKYNIVRIAVYVVYIYLYTYIQNPYNNEEETEINQSQSDKLHYLWPKDQSGRIGYL